MLSSPPLLEIISVLNGIRISMHPGDLVQDEYTR